MVLEPVLVQRQSSGDAVKHGQSDAASNAKMSQFSMLSLHLYSPLYLTVGIYRRSSNRLPIGRKPRHSRLHEADINAPPSLKTLKKIVISKRSMKPFGSNWNRPQTIVAFSGKIWWLKSMRCGVSSVQRNSNVGCGTRPTMARVNIGVCVVQSSR